MIFSIFGDMKGMNLLNQAQAIFDAWIWCGYANYS
jgi:hypothetical protein